MKTQAVIYTRVSSQRQVENTSLSEQLRVCKEYCHSKGYDVSEDRIFVEKGESAKTAERTALQDMLAYCTKHSKDIGYVVVYKVDRFSRNVGDFATLRTGLKVLGINVLSVTEPIGGDSVVDNFMGNIFASVAQFDNEVRGERAKNGLKAASLEGGWISHAPTGYINIKNQFRQPTLQIIEAMRKPIAMFFTEFARGNHTQEEAVDLAKRLGVRTNRGDVASRNGIFKMLKAPVYAGFVCNKATNNQMIQGLHEAVIDFNTFQQVQDILSGRKRDVQKGNNYRVKNPDYPLRRFLTCGLCNLSLTASQITGKTQKYKTYHCHRCTIKVNGARVSIPQDVAHQTFEQLLGSVKPQEWAIDLFREIVLRRWNNELKVAQKALNDVDRQIEKIKTQKSNLIELYIEKKLDDETFNEKRNEYDIKKARLEIERSTLKVSESNKEAVVDNAASFLVNLPQAWQAMSLENKQKFQSAVFLSKITVLPDQTFGTPQFSPIIKQVTEVEKHILKNKVDLLERKSTMAEEGRFELPLQISPD